MKPIQVVLTDRECELVDFLIVEGYAKSRADLVRQATKEFAYNRGFIIKKGSR